MDMKPRIYDRFDKRVLESLNEDELALLYLLYHKLFNRDIDLRSVFVQPVIDKIQNAKHLTEEGCKVRDNIIKKIESYYIG
jgi:hypothetical protein